MSILQQLGVCLSHPYAPPMLIPTPASFLARLGRLKQYGSVIRGNRGRSQVADQLEDGAMDGAMEWAKLFLQLEVVGSIGPNRRWAVCGSFQGGFRYHLVFGVLSGQQGASAMQ